MGPLSTYQTIYFLKADYTLYRPLAMKTTFTYVHKDKGTRSFKKNVKCIYWLTWLWLSMSDQPTGQLFVGTRTSVSRTFLLISFYEISHMGRVGGVSVLTIHQEAFLRSWTWTCIWAQIYYRNLPSRPSQPHKYRQISWISWKWYVGAGHTVRAVIPVFGHRASPPLALKHTQLLGAPDPHLLLHTIYQPTL